MGSNDVEKEQVVKVIKGVFQAQMNRDMEKCLSFFQDAEDLLVLGTDMNEVRVGKNELRIQIEQDFSDTTKIETVIDKAWTRISGDVAWITALLTKHTEYTNGKSIDKPQRLTAILVRNNEKWLISHWHKSDPKP